MTLAVAAASACSYRSGPTQVAAHVASVTVATAVSPPSVGVGQTIQFTSTPRDSHGNPVTGLAVVWSSSDASVATVDAAGLVRGVRSGATAKISALIESATGSLDITVTP